MSQSTFDITAHIAGQRVPRTEVLAWEVQRAAKVAKKLGVFERSSDATTLRRILVERKLELGHDGIELRAGDPTARPVWQPLRLEAAASARWKSCPAHAKTGLPNRRNEKRR